MNSLLIALTDIILTDFIKYQQERARVAGWVPGEADKQGFLDMIRADTTEKIENEVAAEAGKTWADRQPPKPEGN